ncbi:hypothetical protein ACFWBC_10335 [Streptomyces sp. NPDC059985]|uniref:hypothetical protein n=1 Tax=Streptomyces sp. NPDC059985 TaxID=3347025 RepID=UPI0036B8A501
MPLNTLVTLPEGSLAVHSFSKTLSAGELAVVGGRDALDAAVREGVRWVSDCRNAASGKADVEVTEHNDGAAHAVARILCPDATCVAVAERSRAVDDDELAEAEGSRRWAVGAVAAAIKGWATPQSNPVSSDWETWIKHFVASPAPLSEAPDLTGVLDQLSRAGRSHIVPDTETLFMRDEMADILRQSSQALADEAFAAQPGDEEARRAALIRLLSTPRGPIAYDADGQSSATTWAPGAPIETER